MRRFTHTFPQRISAFLLCLALLVGLLPTTALAAAPNVQKIYVGGEEVTSGGYWATDSEGKVTSAGTTQPSNNYIHYDAGNNTLTLHNATIKEEVPLNTSTYVVGAAIGVINQSGDAGLTITLEGTNTIAKVGKGIYVLASSNSTGDASLTITSESGGSLDASGSSNPGIWVQSNSGNATLTIQNAEVTATSTDGDGVQVRSDAQKSASLTVDGGSLTATGKNESGAGIRYTFGSSSSGSGKPSLTVSGNAIVKASGGEGGIANNSSTSIQYGTGNGENGGIVFDGNKGTVYGSVTLQENLTIGEGESLTIPDGASLTIDSGATLTNEGTVTTEEGGTLTNNGKIDNSGTLPDNIQGSAPPKFTTASLPNGEVDKNYSQHLAADNNPTKWSVANGTLPNGLTLENGTISGTPTAAGTSTFTVTATNDNGSDSKALTLTINPAPILVTGVTLNKSELALYTGGSATLTAAVAPDNATNKTVTWASSNPSVATVENGVVTAVGAGTVTITVATVDGGYTATCAVTVEKPYTPPPYIPPSKPNWTSVARKLANAQPGDTVTVKMNGETEVPGEVWETIAGRDVTVVLDMGGNVSWTVDGNDVPTATHFADMDFGVDRNTTGIDVDVINAITGEVSSVQITLAHDGEFGFTLTLTAPLGRENAGRWANLYHYNEDAESLSYETSGEIQEDGTASLKMTHASQYAIVIDDKSHDLPFTDLGEGQWYESAVRYAYLHDIMEGMSETEFAPATALTRAMAVQIFYNLEGQPDISDENLGYPYEDVDAQAWYGDAVYWARITGVATGYGDGTFQPTDSITRQEFAQMLYNYAKYKGYDLTAQGDLSQFPDSGSVADWAEAAMSWANGNELINGHDDGTIDAAGIGTRAQAASILMRFDQNVVEN